MSNLAAARKQFPHLNAYTDQELLGIVAQQNNIASDSPMYARLEKEVLGYDRTAGQVIKDAVVGVGQGVASMAQAVGTVAGNKLAEQGELIDSVGKRFGLNLGAAAKAKAANRYDNPIVNAAADTREWMEQFKSEGLRNQGAGAALAGDIAATEARKRGAGAMGVIGAQAKAAAAGYMENPGTAVQDVVSNIPQLIGPALAGRAAQAGALASGLSARVAGRVGLGAGVGAGGFMQGMDIGRDTYQRAIKAGASPEAAAQLADEAALKSGAATVALSLTPLGGTIERSLLRGAAGSTAGRGLGQIGGRALAGVGEAVSEGLEEGYGQFAGNQGVKRVDPNTDLALGVGTAAVQGAVAGGPMGAIMARPGARTETGEIPLVAPTRRTGADPMDEPAYQRRGQDPLNERSSPWQPGDPGIPTLTAAVAPEAPQQVMMVTPDGTVLPPQTPEQMARLDEMRRFTDGIPTLTDELAPADGVPVVNEQVAVPAIPTLDDQLAPADGIPVLTEEVPNPQRPNRGTLLSSLQGASKELGKSVVKKDGQLAGNRAAAPLRPVLESSDPLGTLRSLHQDGNDTRDELLDLWHKNLTGQTVFEWKAAQQAPAAEPVTQAQVTPPVALEAAAMAQEATAVAAEPMVEAPAVVEPAAAVVEPAAAVVEPAAAAPAPVETQDAPAVAAEAPKKKSKGDPKFGRHSTEALIEISDTTKDEAEYEQSRYELYKRWANGDEMADAYMTEGFDVSTAKGLGKFLARPEIKAFKLRHDAEIAEKGTKRGQKLGKKFGVVSAARAGNPDVGKSRKVEPTDALRSGRTAAQWLRDNAEKGEDRLVAGKIAQHLDGVEVVWVAEGTEVPEQVAQYLNANARGVSALDPETGVTTVYLRSDTGAYEDVLLHELIHAATQRALENPANAHIVAELNKLRTSIRSALSREAYNFAGDRRRGDFGQFFMRVVDDAHELLAYAYASPSLRAYLKTIDASGNKLQERQATYRNDLVQPSAFQRLVNLMRSLVGLPAKYHARFEAALVSPGGGVEGDSVYAQLDQGFDAILAAAKAPAAEKVSANKSNSRPLGTFSVAFKKWFGGSKVVDANGNPLVLYRGLRGNIVDTTDMAPRGDYAVFASSSPHVANTYANIHPVRPYPEERGAVFPIYVSADKIIEFPIKNGNFDMFAFDRRAKALLPGEALVARGVYDAGPQAFKPLDPDQLYSYAADTWAFGKGTSIKSATGNNGDYNPANPDIRANLSSAMTKPLADTARAVHASVKAQTSGAEISPKLLSIMTLRQIAEQFGTKLPAMRDWIDAIMRRSSNASKLAAEADRVALQWEQSVKDPAERAALAEVLLRASIAELELDNTSQKYLDALSPEQRAEHTALRAKLDALSPDSRRTREQALAILRRQWEYTRDSLESFINHTVADPGLRNQRIEDLKRELGRNRGDYFPLSRFGDRIVVGRSAAADGRDVVSFHETAASADAEIARLKALGKKVDVTLKAAYDNTTRTTTGFIGQLHSMIDGTETDPSVKDSMHEALQQLFLKSLPELAGAKAMIRRENVEGYSRDALRVFADSVTRGSRYASQLEYAPMIQAARESAEAQSRSSDKRTAAVVIGRRDGEPPRVMIVPVGTDRLNAVNRMESEGYATEFFNTIPESAAERLAGALQGETKEKIAAYVKDVELVVGRTSEGVEDMRAAKALYNHMIRLQQTEANEDSGAVVQALGQAGYVWYLGLSPAFWAINTLQNPMIGIPHLASKYGVGKASAEWGSAMKWFAGVRMGKAMNDGKTPFSVEWLKEAVKSGQLTGITKQELDMLQALEDRQVLDFTQAMDLSRIGQVSSDGKLGRLKFNAMRFAAAGAHHTEVFNRVTFALAAYRLAIKSDGNVSHEEAVRRAENDTAAVHFDYSYANKPALMRGKVSRLMFMFQQYRQHMLYWWAKNIKDMVKDEAPGDRQRALKAALLMGTTQGIFAGAMGLPFVGAVAFLANLLAGDDDDGVPFDFNRWILEAAKEQVGDEAGEVMAKGIFAVMGMNISQRIGQADLMPFLNQGGSAKYERTSDDKIRAFAYDLAGPLGSLALSAGRSLDAFERGDTMAGLAAVAPKFISDLLKAGELESEGAKNSRGELLATAEAFDGWDVAMQAAGVVPTAVANVKADGAKIRSAEAGIEKRTRELTGQFVEAWSRQDQEGLTEVMAAIQRFNAAVGAKYRDQSVLIDRRQLESAIKDRQNRALMLALSGGTAETKRQLMIAKRTSGLFNQVTDETVQQNAGNLPGLPGLPGLSGR